MGAGDVESQFQCSDGFDITRCRRYDTREGKLGEIRGGLQFSGVFRAVDCTQILGEQSKKNKTAPRFQTPYG